MSLKQTNTQTQCKINVWSQLDDHFLFFLLRTTLIFYHGLLPVRQSYGHRASCFIRGHHTLGDVGFGETMGQCRDGPCFVQKRFIWTTQFDLWCKGELLFSSFGLSMCTDFVLLVKCTIFWLH